MKSIRTRFDGDNKKLCRARRLYKFLCRNAVLKSPMMAHVFAKRGLDRGLWAKNTGYGDAAFAIARYAFRCQSEYTWHEFLRLSKTGVANPAKNPVINIPRKIKVYA